MKNSSAWHKKVVKPIAKMVDTALDPSVVFSFDKTGFLRHRVQFNDADLMVEMTGKNCIVTGGNSGLGLATAEALASRGATVWILGRNSSSDCAHWVEFSMYPTINPAMFLLQVIDVSIESLV